VTLSAARRPGGGLDRAAAVRKRDDWLHPRQTSTVPDRTEPPDRPVPEPPREAVQRWRLVVARMPLEPDPGQREQLAGWERALVASRLPVAGLDADPPRPRFALAAPLSAPVAGEAELVDVWLSERVPAWRVRPALASSMPVATTLVEAYDVWLGEPALPGQVVASVYRAELAPGAVGTAALADACATLLGATSLPRLRAKGQTTVAYDLRPFVDGLEVDATASHGRLRMVLRHDPERGVGRPDEVIAELSDRLGSVLEVASLVRERLVLAPSEPVPEPPARRPRRRQATDPGNRTRR
jgi:hypothetical protein